MARAKQPWDDDGTDSAEFMAQAMWARGGKQDFARGFIDTNTLDDLAVADLRLAIQNVDEMRMDTGTVDFSDDPNGLTVMIDGLDKAVKYLSDEIKSREE